MLEKFKITAKKPTTWKVLGLCALLASSSTGYCADGAMQELDSQVNMIQKVIFGPVIRGLVLGFAFAWGVLKGFMTNSLVPIIMYLGLGSCFFFVPSLINLFKALGT